MVTAQPRTLRLGSREYEVVFPALRDPRLLIAAVVFTVLILGMARLGFPRSVPQILVAILTGIVIDGVMLFRKTGKLYWPASGVNTASGVILITMAVGTEAGDLWSWNGWYYYVGLTAFGLFTKHAIRHRGAHVFNPSNVALAVGFFLLGSSRVEPLDFWWGPFGPTIAIAYVIILIGGTQVLRGLKMLTMPVAFWLVLAGGLGILAASGHCFTAPWSFQPVCSNEFWWVVVTSPEMLFFLFFMITDPKTIPTGRIARIAFAMIIGVVAVLLMAPQTTEFGAKVGLLASVAIVSPFRWLIDRWLPETDPEQSRVAAFIDRFSTSDGVQIGKSRTFLKGAVGGAVVAGIAMLVFVAGTPARDTAIAAPVIEPVVVEVEVDASTLPAVTADDDPMISAMDPDAIALMLAEDLEIEAEAMRRGESELLLAADTGARLEEMQGQLEGSIASGEWTVAQYTFDSLHLRTVPAFGGQGRDLAFDATGTLVEVIQDGDGNELDSGSSSFSATFVLRMTGDDRWQILEKTDAG